MDTNDESAIKDLDSFDGDFYGIGFYRFDLGPTPPAIEETFTPIRRVEVAGRHFQVMVGYHHENEIYRVYVRVQRFDRRQQQHDSMINDYDEPPTDEPEEFSEWKVYELNDDILKTIRDLSITPNADEIFG